MAMVPRLVAEEGALVGTEIVLEEASSWIIGADQASCAIVLQEEGVGAQQAVITVDPVKETYFIRNLNLAASVSVNETVVAEAECPLEEGDIIILGQSVFRFFPNADELVFYDVEDKSSAENNETDQKKSNEEGKASFEKQEASSEVKDSAVQSVEEKSPIAEKSSSTEIPPSVASETAVAKEDIPAKPEDSNEAQESKEEKDKTPDENQKINPEADTANAVVEDEIEAFETTAAVSSKKSKKKKDAMLSVEQEDTVTNSDEQPSDKKVTETATVTKKKGTKKKEEKTEQSEDAEESSVKPALPEEAHLPAENQGEKFKVEDLFAFDDGIFEDKEKEEHFVDLAATSRFLLKVIAGPNVGAEFGLDSDKIYIMGTDTTSCDVIFNDLSVSHKHAQLEVATDGKISIKDLQSRNGILIDGKRVSESSVLAEGAFVSLGTTVFSVIDREHPAVTLVAGSFFKMDADRIDHSATITSKENSSEESQKSIDSNKVETNTPFASGILIMALLIGGLAILFGIGTASLFGEKEIKKERIDFHHEINNVIKPFPSVNFSYNKTTGELFLSGHVKSGLERNELIHNISGLSFIKILEDYVVDDEAVWQEMNLLLTKQKGYQGVSVHSPAPGKFVLTGYLKSEAQGAALADYVHLNFSYSSLLDNQVVVEEAVARDIATRLLQNGFVGVNSSFISGEVSFTGFANSAEQSRFTQLVNACKSINGVRSVTNTVLFLGSEQDIIDLKKRYPNRYRVTGSSKLGAVVVNVVINGKILARGDVLDGLTVTGIQPTTIFFEKDNLKYKLDYNSQ